MWSCRVPRVRVYIHDISQVVAVLDQPPPFSSQSLHDTVKGPDGLKQEHTSDQSGRPKGSGSTGLVGSMNQFKQQSFFFLPPASLGREDLVPVEAGPDGGEPQTAD